MQVHEFVDEGLGHSSYVINLGEGSAAVVDPPRFPTEHEALIDRAGWVLRWTIDTHSHADYVTCSPGLVACLGVTFIAPTASNLETPHRAILDGEQVALAPDVTLTAIATPGHTPDHHAYALEVDGVPVALFTGGSLMVGTVGRTDLCGPELAVPLAHEMFRSLHRFDDLPDTLAVYPTHGAGSFCSAPGAAERTSTLGRERATNPLLSIPDEGAFVARLVDGFGTFPTYFARLPELNRRGPTRIDTLPTLPVLDVDDVARRAADGAVVVDARPFVTFGAGHLGGTVIDVRQANEYAAGHIPFAQSIELGSIPTAPMPSDSPVTVMCGHGERAMSAASLLAPHRIATRVFDGGPHTWATSTGQALVAGR